MNTYNIADIIFKIAVKDGKDVEIHSRMVLEAMLNYLTDEQAQQLFEHGNAYLQQYKQQVK